MKKLHQYVTHHWYVSPMRKWSYDLSGDASTDTFTGETIYIGSSHSNTQICIYDKKLERFTKDIEVFETVWYRVEVRFMQDRAKWFVSNFLAHCGNDNDFSFIPEALYTVLEFKEPTVNGKETSDKTKSRWDSAQWWLDFLGVASKADFSHQHPVQTIDRKIDWLDRCVSRPLLQVYSANANTSDFLKLIFQIMRDKFEDFSHIDLSIINAKRKKEGLPELTDDDLVKIKVKISCLLKKILFLRLITFVRNNISFLISKKNKLK